MIAKEEEFTISLDEDDDIKQIDELAVAQEQEAEEAAEAESWLEMNAEALLAQEEPVELLSDDELDDLARRYSDVDELSIYFKEIRQYALFTLQEELDVFAQVAKGDLAAREKAIKANLRLVISIAKKYQGRGLTFNEVIQEGNIGLMRAVDKFDLSRKNKFSTMATYWIRQQIGYEIAQQANSIRIPVHMRERLHTFNKQVQAMSDLLHRKPSPAEISKELEMAEEDVRKLQRLNFLQPMSYDEPIKNHEDGDGDDLLDFIASELSTDEEFNEIDMKELLNHILSQALEKWPREELIIRLRFGLERVDADGNRVQEDKWILNDIAEEVGVTRERIRQLIKQGLRRIKKYVIGHQGYLHTYLEEF